MFAGYTWPTWSGLSYWERVDAVAFYRVHRLIDLHRGDAEAQAIEQSARRP